MSRCGASMSSRRALVLLVGDGVANYGAEAKSYMVELFLIQSGRLIR